MRAPFISFEELFLTCGVERSEMSCIFVSVIMLPNSSSKPFLVRQDNWCLQIYNLSGSPYSALHFEALVPFSMSMFD